MTLPGLASWAARSLGASRVRRGADAEFQALPPSLWPTDRAFVAEWADGHFALAGVTISLSGRSPFDIREAPEAWLDALYSFEWLRHLPIGNNVGTNAFATPDSPSSGTDARSVGVALVRAAVTHWLKFGIAKSTRAQQETVIARRVLSWLTHADALLDTETSSVYDEIIDAFLADVQDIERRWSSMEAYDARLLALAAMAAVSLCHEDCALLRRDAEAGLSHELSPRRTPAAVEFLRNPDALAGMILDLEALRILYKLRLQKVPDALTNALARFTGVLAGLQLGDGSITRLGAPRNNPESQLLQATIVRNLGLPKAPPHIEPNHAYCRLAAAGTVVVVDTGAPLGSRYALELAMSSGKAPVFVSDGRETLPSKPSSSTATVITNHSVGVEPLKQLPSLQAFHSVDADLTSPARQRIDATHAGPTHHGFVHRRQVTLESDGRQLTGIDELRPLIGRENATVHIFTLRFVLHPSVRVMPNATADRLDLLLADGQQWSLLAPGHIIAADADLYRDGLRTVPTIQITVTSGSEASRTVTWQLVRRDDKDQPRKAPSTTDQAA